MRSFITIWMFCKGIQIIMANCENSSICLSQYIRNAGHHRVLQYLIEVGVTSSIYQMDCTLCIHQPLPSSLYVNSDQLNELRKFNQVLYKSWHLYAILKTINQIPTDAHQLAACALEKIDIEKPKHISPEINIHIYTMLNATTVSIDLPIHLRYQSAKFDGGYEKVQIPKPSLLIKCNTNNEDNYKDITHQAPCTVCSHIYCNWSDQAYDFITKPADLLMPVGNLNHYPFVVIITLLVTCAGCVYILSSLALCQNRENVIVVKKIQ